LIREDFDPAALARAHEWLNVYARFWDTRLDTLQQILEKEEES
jgi:hypothetical protein